MGQTNISNAVSSNMAGAISDVTIATKETDGISDQEETTWTNSNWSKWWGYFNAIADLQSALIMKSIWNVGKGWTADPETTIILEHISGWGKDTFDDVLFNMDLIKNVGGDSYAEIIRDEDTGTLLNLKPLDPGSIRIVIGRNGVIKRYEQISKTKGNLKIFQPEDILHFSNNRFADNIHGISKIEALEQTILADNENFVDMKKLMHHQVKPFILWKLKTDDQTKINQLVAKIDAARNLGEDMFIPDDDDAIEYEVIQVPINAAVFQWREDIRNKFYRALGMPLILFGASGSTESGGKMETFAHETVFEHSQRWIEKQLWNQLQIKIDLIPPQTLLNNLQNDESKDAGQGLEMQPQDMTAGAG